jgi:hydroxyacylglutathione hydrolase
LSGEGRGPWSYTDAYIAESGAHLVRAGESIRVGNVRVDVIHTPGHTPEHLTFLVTDTAGAAEPMGAVTGDFVFVGDVGRPDLLERAVQVAGSADAMARQLYHSLVRFAGWPDYLQLWPGHGAGSACGKDLSAVPQSTLGYERRHNWAFRIEDEETFVAAALEGQPEPPAYFAEMKRLNASGPRPWPDVMRPARLAPDEFAEAVARGGPVIDTRPAAEFAAGHIPGTINIPFDRSFLTWAGTLVPMASEIVLVGSETRLAVVVRSLALIGLDQVVGYAAADVLEAWERSRGPLARVRELSADEVAEALRQRAVSVVDVRGMAEWESGHLPEAIHVPLGVLRDRLAELPRDRPLIAQCQSGGRSAIAASIMQAAGFRDVAHLRGGLAAWQRAGHALARDGPA